MATEMSGHLSPGETSHPKTSVSSARKLERWDIQTYDDFGDPGYSLTEYAKKWMTPNGLGEMQLEDTRRFDGGRFSLSAIPFRTTSDVGVDDHRKYLAVSTYSFPVPAKGTLVLSSDIRASTSGTIPDLVQQGVFGPSGTWTDPSAPPSKPRYTAQLLQGQQAALVMNAIDFCTGQLFDWFVSSDTAFALIERLPTTVTGNVLNPDCPDATEVGIDQMYTQIICEVPVSPDASHRVDIALTRHDNDGWVDYFIDGRHVAHVGDIGIPLDKQGVTFTGTYPSRGPGERLARRLDSMRFGHGMFSLVDAFPFQHPGDPDLSVSIPAVSELSANHAGRARLYGQGASGSFGNFTTLTTSGRATPASPSEILRALGDARTSSDDLSPRQ